MPVDNPAIVLVDETPSNEANEANDTNTAVLEPVIEQTAGETTVQPEKKPFDLQAVQLPCPKCNHTGVYEFDRRGGRGRGMGACNRCGDTAYQKKHAKGRGFQTPFNLVNNTRYDRKRLVSRFSIAVKMVINGVERVARLHRTEETECWILDENNTPQMKAPADIKVGDTLIFGIQLREASLVDPNDYCFGSGKVIEVNERPRESVAY